MAATQFPGSAKTLALPLLVTGITGVTGFNAFHYFQNRYPGQVIGIRPRLTFALKGEGILGVDADDFEKLDALFENYRFGSVLNCAGNCALKSCELNPEMADRLNVATAQAILQASRIHGSRLVHLSSDLVFSGKGTGLYREDDLPDPVSVYGKTMLAAEVLVLNRCPTAAVLRISLPMGPSFNRHAGAIDWIDSRFRKGRPATLYFDEIRSCTYTDDLNPVFERFLSGAETGIYHLGGPRHLSLYQIGQVVNRVGGYAAGLLKGCMRKEAGPIPPRAGNVSLDSSKLHRLLGEAPFQPWPIHELWTTTDPDWFSVNSAIVEQASPASVATLYHYRLGSEKKGQGEKVRI